MLIHIEQDYDLATAVHRTNMFTATLKKGQFLNLQSNSTFESSTITREYTDKFNGTRQQNYTEVQVHRYKYIIMVYYDEIGEPEAPAPRGHLSS